MRCSRFSYPSTFVRILTKTATYQYDQITFSSNPTPAGHLGARAPHTSKPAYMLSLSILVFLRIFLELLNFFLLFYSFL